MKSIFTLFFLMMMLLSLPGNLSAQNTEPDSGGETKKSFVSVPVTVSDREGRYLANLKKEDFTVLQNGVKQKITFFSTFREPLKLVLLLDTSKSTRDVIGKIRDAAEDFVSSLNSDDQCQIATFDSTVKIINPFTSDRKTIKNSLDKIAINEYGATLMYNAVDKIARESFKDVAGKDVTGRKVIVLLTDGNDFGSTLTKNEFLNSLEESDILIYTLFFKTGNDFDDSAASGGTASKKGKKKKKSRKKKNQNMILNPAQSVYIQTDEEVRRLETNDENEAIDTMKKMSDATAGRFYQSSVPDLKKTFRNITRELTQQYRLGYDARNSAAGDAASREIIVKVDRPDVVVRTRANIRNSQP